ncbi:MAG: hypothetical protein R2875_03580 [Desulfobacterales bacterium]
MYTMLFRAASTSREAYFRAEKLLKNPAGCYFLPPCETGCPSCVHSPETGSGNRPIDKAAIYIPEQIIDARRPGDADATATTFT